MKTRNPTSQEIQELVSFLPVLSAEGFTPVTKWSGGSENSDGVITMTFPEYDDAVKAFMKAASCECWADYDYQSKVAAKMLKNKDVIETADMDRIKTMLTFCVRGERFCDGHWEKMIQEGHVIRLLQRLTELQ